MVENLIIFKIGESFDSNHFYNMSLLKLKYIFLALKLLLQISIEFSFKLQLESNTSLILRIRQIQPLLSTNPEDLKSSGINCPETVMKNLFMMMMLQVFGLSPKQAQPCNGPRP